MMFMSLSISLCVIISATLSQTDDIQHYIREFSKPSNRFSDQMRLEAFRNNAQRIAEHNSEPTAHYSLKLSRFSDYLRSEVVDYFGGESLGSSSQFSWPTSSRPPGSQSTSIRNPRTNSIAKTITNTEGGGVTTRPVSLPLQLNWASSNNPVHKSIVSPVRDQGSCGACWAFVAVGSTEASIRLSQARSNTTSAATATAAAAPTATTTATVTAATATATASISEDSNRNISDITGDLTVSGFLFGTSDAHHLLLSPQELIDCDSSTGNMGCKGGRPIGAFMYIEAEGLATERDYPFFGAQGRCASGSILSAGSISSWTAIASGHEYLMQQYLFLNGPVAVGICGSDFNFIHYANGIFDSSTCCIDQNHAVLLVGYGVDELTGLDYWIAQNSWGDSWGDGGYIKLLRTTFGSGSGMCGIATNPSQALGGYDIANANPYSLHTSFYETLKAWLWVLGRETVSYSSALWLFILTSWQFILLTLCGFLFFMSLFILVFTCVLDTCVHRRPAQLHPDRGRYVRIDGGAGEQVAGGTDYSTYAVYPQRVTTHSAEILTSTSSAESYQQQL